MRADWRAKLDVELEASLGYKPNSADWLDGRWADIKAARDPEDPRRGQTGAPLDLLKTIGEKTTAIPSGFHAHRTIQRFLENRRRAIETGRALTGPRQRRWHSARSLPEGHRFVYPVRTPSAARSRNAIRCWSTRTTKTVTSRSTISGEDQARFEPSTRCCRRKRLWASLNTATRWPSSMRSRCGRRNWGFRQRRSGGLRPVRASGERGLRMSGLVSLPHGYEGQDRSIPQRGSSSAFCRCARGQYADRKPHDAPANYFHILRAAQAQSASRSSR
jgi:2-oxoglutarate dehydrogenase E1 component